MQEYSEMKHAELVPTEDLEFISNSSHLFSIHPFVDSSGLLQQGCNAQLPYSIIHPIILPGKHPITSLLISSEHRRLICTLDLHFLQHHSIADITSLDVGELFVPLLVAALLVGTLQPSPNLKSLDSYLLNILPQIMYLTMLDLTMLDHS